MTAYVPVAGTHDWAPRRDAPRWWQAASPFTETMRLLGMERRGQEWPFWSTALAGTFWAQDGAGVLGHGDDPRMTQGANRRPPDFQLIVGSMLWRCLGDSVAAVGSPGWSACW